jgi:major membrane immunogen (membrane-anchored lipoprotein)
VHKTGREKEDKSAKRTKIRALNDAFRKSFRGGRIMMTAGVAAIEATVRNAVVEKIRSFDAFDDDNDPWGEHDFVSVELDGQTYFAKIDYYDRKLEAHSEDAADPEKTCRVMTIMLAEEH